MADAPTSCKQAFDMMPSRFNKEASKGLSAVYQFDLAGDGGGKWYVTIANERCEVKEGAHTSPNITISMSAQDYLDLVNPDAVQNGLDPLLIYAVMRQESAFDPVAGSSAEAAGAGAGCGLNMPASKSFCSKTLPAGCGWSCGCWSCGSGDGTTTWPRHVGQLTTVPALRRAIPIS